jgi:hypothetical protein
VRKRVRIIGITSGYSRRKPRTSADLRIEAALGGYVNLGLLRQYVPDAPPELLDALVKEETELRQRALEIGARCIARSPV